MIDRLAEPRLTGCWLSPRRCAKASAERDPHRLRTDPWFLGRIREIVEAERRSKPMACPGGSDCADA